MRRSASQIIRNLEMRIARLEKSALSPTAIDFFCTSANRDGTSNFRNSQGVNIFFDVDRSGAPMIRGNQRLHMKKGIYESLNAMMKEYGKTNYYEFTAEVEDAVSMFLNGKGHNLGSILDHYYKHFNKSASVNQSAVELALAIEKQISFNRITLKDLSKNPKLLDLDEIEDQSPSLKKEIQAWVRKGWITIEGGEYEESRGGQSYPAGWDAYLITQSGIKELVSLLSGL